MQSVKFAVGVALLYTASAQPFAAASPTAVPNLAFIRLPGFSTAAPPVSPFEFRNVEIPTPFVLQGDTPIPVEWWEKGSDSPLAVVIGNAEGTRNLDGSKRSAYYWHTDPGNGADNFGSFSFQHLSAQEKQAALSQGSSQELREIAARQALPEIADQRQLEKLRRFHDLLLAQARKHDLQLTELELINGLDLATQSELAGLDSWGYVDRLAQAKETIKGAEEQIIQARTWSYWDPVTNRWAASGLGNTEYRIRRDQTRRFEALKQALKAQHQLPSALQTIDIAWLPAEGGEQVKSQKEDAKDAWAIAQLEEKALGGGGFNAQPLQLELPHDGLDALRAEMNLHQAELADAVAQSRNERLDRGELSRDERLGLGNAAALADASQQDEIVQLASLDNSQVQSPPAAAPVIAARDLDFKAALLTAKEVARPQLSVEEGVEIALQLDRPLELDAQSPIWDSMAMEPEEFALATGVAIASSELSPTAVPQPGATGSSEPVDWSDAQLAQAQLDQGESLVALSTEDELTESTTAATAVVLDGTVVDGTVVEETTGAIEAVKAPPSSALSSIVTGTSQLVAELTAEPAIVSLAPEMAEQEQELMLAVEEDKEALLTQPLGSRFVPDPFADPMDEEQLGSEYLGEEYLNERNTPTLAIQPLMPEALRSLPTDSPAPVVIAPAPEPLAPDQPFKRTPELAKAVTEAHVHAVEPLVLDRIEEARFLTLADGLKESPIAVTANSIGLPAEVSEVAVVEAEPLQIRFESPDAPMEEPYLAEEAAVDALPELESVPEAIAPLLAEPLVLIPEPEKQVEAELLLDGAEDMSSGVGLSEVAVEPLVQDIVEASPPLDETIQYFEEDVFAEEIRD